MIPTHSTSQLVDICIYSKSARNTTIRSPFLRPEGIKKILIFLLICATLFFTVQLILKLYLTQLNEKLTMSLQPITSIVQPQQENTSSSGDGDSDESIRKLETIMQPVENEYLIRF